MPLNGGLSVRRTKEQKLKRHRELLAESVRKHVLPAIIQQGFASVPRRPMPSFDRKSSDIFPFEQMRRTRLEGGVDLIEIQFMTYRRAAFRINACAVPKEGLMTLGGHRSAEECVALGIHDLESHARPWLRPLLRMWGLEPLGSWFSLWLWRFRSPVEEHYKKLALRVAAVVPEIEFALRAGRLGPHIRRVKIPRHLG